MNQDQLIRHAEQSADERTPPRIDHLVVVHLLFTSSQLSGREVVVAELARAQNNLPHTRATVVAVGTAASRALLKAGSTGGTSVVPGRGPSAWLHALRVLLSVRPAADATHVLHTHGLFALLLVCALRLPPCTRWRRAAVVHTNHGFRETVFVRRLLLPVELFLSRFVDRVVVCSPLQAVHLAAVVSRPVDLVLNGVVVRPPATPRQRAEARANLCLPDWYPLVGIVARLAPEKRHDVFLDAGERIVRSCPDAVLLIAGEGPRRDEVHKMVRKRNLVERVRLLGHVANIEDVYASLDLLLHTSDTEGTPLAVIEAMAAGVPVVATAVGGVPALVVDEVHGLLVPRRRPDLLAVAAMRVLSDPALRRALIRSARARVIEELAVERMSAQLKEVYVAAGGR